MEVIAKVTEVSEYNRNHETHHQVYIEYTCNNHKYSHVSYNNYSDTLKEGKCITVDIDPKSGAVTNRY